jgi:uncharacterized membrane protein
MEFLVILSRWLHVIAACLALGGLFFMRIILPLGLAQADPASRDAVFLRCRRVFKMMIHTCILLFLLTGTYNSYRAWDDYRLTKGVMHALWGTHVLFGGLAIILAIVLLQPKAPPPWHRTGAMTNLILLLLAVAAASSVKYVRENAIRTKTPATAPSAP